MEASPLTFAGKGAACCWYTNVVPPCKFEQPFLGLSCIISIHAIRCKKNLFGITQKIPIVQGKLPFKRTKVIWILTTAIFS